jgi:hypothetical protein
MKHGDEFFSSLSFFFSLFFREREIPNFFLVLQALCAWRMYYRPRSTLCDHTKREKRVLFSCERDYTLRTFNGLK